jgi:hypothetical protein
MSRRHPTRTRDTHSEDQAEARTNENANRFISHICYRGLAFKLIHRGGVGIPRTSAPGGIFHSLPDPSTRYGAEQKLQSSGRTRAVLEQNCQRVKHSPTRMTPNVMGVRGAETGSLRELLAVSIATLVSRNQSSVQNFAAPDWRTPQEFQGKGPLRLGPLPLEFRATAFGRVPVTCVTGH